ncbi:MAG: hypothetical protein DUD30_01345 [Lactobacillus sp.]|nr:MAG: hypothetical protein DUD30_01345 [Lactobacillus sp.]
MATPNVGILTTAGKALIDKVNSGQAKISFSKIVFSSMDNSQLSDMQVKTLTAIAPQEVVVSSPETTLDTNSGETRIRATGTNEKLADGVYVKTYGVFAKDDTGSEILYGVTVSPNPNYFPAYDGVTPQAVTYSYKTVIQETSNITMTNSNDVYASQEDLTEALQPYAKTVDVNQQLDKKVNIADMRKPASDVAGIEEVNAKQDKIGYTPADDRKVLHSTITQSSGTDLNTMLTAGFFNIMNGLNTAPNSDNWTIYQIIPLLSNNGFQIAYMTNSSSMAKRSWSYINGNLTFTNWAIFADDSKILHSAQDSSQPNGLDLNLYQNTGNYRFDNVTTVNYPPTFSPIYLQLVVFGNDGILSGNAGSVIQIAIQGHTEAVRNMYTGGTWNAWRIVPDDSLVVHTADMRKPASDVASIDEVNAKQDKIGYTPADDSKVAHLSGANNFDTVPTVNNNPLLLASSLPSDLARTGSNQEFTGKNTFDTAPIDKTTGNPYITKDGVPSDVARTGQANTFSLPQTFSQGIKTLQTGSYADANSLVNEGLYFNTNLSIKNAAGSITGGFIQVLSGGVWERVRQFMYSDLANNLVYTRVSSDSGSTWSNWVQIITSDQIPTDLARTSQQTNFTAGLQSGGVDVATAADLKSVADKAWYQLDNKYIVPASGYTLGPTNTLLYKIDDSTHTLYLSGSIALTDDGASNVPVTVQLGSIIKSISTLSVPYFGYDGISPNWTFGYAHNNNSTNLTFFPLNGVLGIASNAGKTGGYAFVHYGELV